MMRISINTDSFSYEDYNFTAQEISLDTVGSSNICLQTDATVFIMAKRSGTPEPFDCEMPPNEIDETFPMLEPAVFTLDPQNVEEDLEVINEHNLNSATFWRGVGLQYHQTFLEIRAEVNEANILEEPLNAEK